MSVFHTGTGSSAAAKSRIGTTSDRGAPTPRQAQARPLQAAMAAPQLGNG